MGFLARVRLALVPLVVIPCRFYMIVTNRAVRLSSSGRLLDMVRSAIWTANLLFALAESATAAPMYRCKGERIEKGSSTWGYAKASGSEYRIEKGSSSIGWAKKRGSKWSIETFSGSTLGWLNGDRIEKPNALTWTALSDARCLVRDAPDAVAAALWVLNQHGKL